MTSKYRNVPMNGYASGREAQRAYELHLMERAGQIIDLQEQVPFVVIPKQSGEHSATYIADFTYLDIARGKIVVEDVKGIRTAVYILKRKLMLLVHGIKISEVA